MHPRIRRTLFTLALACMASVTTASAQGRGNTIEVTITNLTSGQIFSPPVIASHNASFELFTPGHPATMELYALAEDGMADPLADLLAITPGVHSVAVGGAIPPGATITVSLPSNGAHRLISVAGMLVSTNDAFFSVRGLAASRGGNTTYAPAWDAGSEANNEDCAYIPGPPCGNGGVRTPTSEGFIHIHNGIHGIDGLDPVLFDWRNPVARVTARVVTSGT